MKIRRNWLGVVLVVAVIGVPLAIGKVRGLSGTEVDLAVVATRVVRPSILASGTLAYRNEVDLTAEVVAKVRMIAVKEGDVVEAGQLLLRLDPESYDNAIEREEASLRQNRISVERERTALALREKQFERSRVLANLQLIDRNRFDEDRNQLEMARADLRSSEEALRRSEAILNDARQQRAKTEIRSPIAGRIVSLPIKVGETAIPSTSALAGAQLMKIAETSVIQAELKVDEADIAKIGIGQQTAIYSAAYPDTPIKGVVEQIALAPTIEGQGRTYKVTVSLAAAKGVELRSGMTVRADIYIGSGAQQLAVPVEAVLSETDEHGAVERFVWLDKAGKASKVAVVTGASDDRWEVVSKGLTKGDTVIAGPARTLRALREGDAVRARPAGAKAADGEREDG